MVEPLSLKLVINFTLKVLPAEEESKVCNLLWLWFLTFWEPVGRTHIVVADSWDLHLPRRNFRVLIGSRAFFWLWWLELLQRLKRRIFRSSIQVNFLNESAYQAENFANSYFKALY